LKYISSSNKLKKKESKENKSEYKDWGFTVSRLMIDSMQMLGSSNENSPFIH
jgi:hypothetical protein